MKKSFLIVGVAVGALIAGQSLLTAADRSSAAVPYITPEGVTAQPLGKAQGYDLGKTTASEAQRLKIAYADRNGLTLYTYDKDPAGKATCVAECARLFTPFIAPEKAKVFGAWSAIKRDDGMLQWALGGKPLYTYVNDIDPGAIAGDSPANRGAMRRNRAGVMVGGGQRGGYDGPGSKIEPLPDGWRAAILFPMDALTPPPGLAIREIQDAALFGLTDGRGHTLYAAAAGTKLDNRWKAVVAPQLAESSGDFAVLERPDGIRQWSYKGQALFTFDGDLAPEDANGVGVDERVHVAAVRRYFMPENVKLEKSMSQGVILATVEGQTLYRRDGYIIQSGGGHSLRRGQPPRPAVGRDLGTDPRCTDCLSHWKPFLAPADAQPWGFWDVAQRADGARQWVYQGYALWTFDGDKKPGDINGHDTYDIFVTDDPTRKIDVGTPMDGGAALTWAVAIP